LFEIFIENFLNKKKKIYDENYMAKFSKIKILKIIKNLKNKKIQTN